MGELIAAPSPEHQPLDTSEIRSPSRSGQRAAASPLTWVNGRHHQFSVTWRYRFRSSSNGRLDEVLGLLPSRRRKEERELSFEVRSTLIHSFRTKVQEA